MRFRVFALIAALQAVALTLWVGSMWTVGYLVAPVLFRSLPDPMMAGDLAGRLFRIAGNLGLVCGAFLLGTVLFCDGWTEFRRWRPRVVLTMFAINLIGQFGLLPAMQKLKDLAHGRLVAATPLAHRFGMLHAVAGTLFLASSLLGLLLVMRGLRPGGGR
ncbi:MAG: DUF4149 domain-containing protein [Acidiferrobacterales bacterium]